MYKILIVDNNNDSYDFFSNALPGDSKVVWMRTLEQGKRLIKESVFDLLLTDLVLPDGSGLELSRELSAQAEQKITPVVVVSSKDTVDDRILSFNAGIDDYIAKPVDRRELKVRIEARLKKYRFLKKHLDSLTFGPLSVDLTSQTSFVREPEEKRPLDLTRIEYKILTLLLTKPEQVMSRDEIIDTVWGKNVHVFQRCIDTHISKLRKKLGTHAELIKSVHGSGYKLSLPPGGFDHAERAIRRIA